MFSRRQPQAAGGNQKFMDLGEVMEATSEARAAEVVA
jgi:hypothetical protein